MNKVESGEDTYDISSNFGHMIPFIANLRKNNNQFEKVADLGVSYTKEIISIMTV